MNRHIVATLTVFVLAAATSPPGMAQKLYKWVDKDGKTHYSQTPPADAAASQSKLNVPKQDSPAPQVELTEDGRDPDGNCKTMKCMADQMEADRLEREQGYATQRWRNERLQEKASEERAAKERAAEPKSRLWPK